jgi:drug/metabolite transporter (DMT)-like permease
LPLLGLGAGLLSAAVFGVAAVVQAGAVRRYPETPDRLVGFVARSLRDGRMMVVVAAYLLGFLLHAVAIWYLPLYLAQALVAMSLPVAALVSHRVEDALRRSGWVAVCLVTTGLVLLSLGAGEPGAVVTTNTFVAILWLGVAALALASLAAGRLAGPLRGPFLGLLAGLGYAGSAISVRGVGTPVEAGVVAAALAVPSFSLVAFWLYSLGMHGAAVPSTTASLIVAQTFIPAAVGVAFLGDGVRDGWWPAIWLGLALSTVGAVLLALRHAPDVRSPASSARR